MSAITVEIVNAMRIEQLEWREKMFHPSHALMIAEMRQQDFEHELRIKQMLKEIRGAAPQPSYFRVGQVPLVWVGRQLVNLGEKLQSGYAQPLQPLCDCSNPAVNC